MKDEIMMKFINEPIIHIRFHYGIEIDHEIWLSDTLLDMKRWAIENQMKIYVDILEIWFLTESDRTLFYLTWSDTDAI